MKSLLLHAALWVGGATFAQTTLFSENFETGGTGFSLNTADMGGQVGSAGTNAWVVNNSYTGGSGTSSCFSLNFTVGTTPAQPGGIANGPNSYYMHILSDDGANNGITNANYAPADGSLCFFAESNFSRMQAPVSTSGYSGVTLSFWWMNAGSSNGFGEVYYSLNGGSSWTLKQSAFFNSGSWTQISLSDPAWDNASSLMIGFRFVNNTATAGSDPALSIDDVLITGTSGGGSTSIATSGFTPSSWCYGTTISDVLDFTANGSYNAGNVFTAELSDASGSFAAPTNIGTLNSSSSGALSINITIPGSVAAGTGYRMRVVSSNPATTGSDNGSDLVINPLPTVTLGGYSDVCVYTPSFSLTGGTPAGGTYTGTGVSSGSFDPATAGLGTHTITYTYTDGNSCTSAANQAIVVDDCLGLNELAENSMVLYPNPASQNFGIAGIEQIDHVYIVDMGGRMVKSFAKVMELYPVDDLDRGVYLVHVELGGRTAVKRLVIE